MKKVMTKGTALLLALLLASLAGCASKQDLQTIEAQRQHDRQRVQELEEELTQAREALKEEIERQNNPVRSTQANIWAEMEQLRRQVGMLDGRLDALERTIDDRTLTQKGEDLGAVAMQVEALRFAMEHQLGVDVAEAEAKVRAMNAPQPVPGIPGMSGQPEQPAQTGDETAAPPAQPETQVQPDPEKPADPAEALYDRALEAFRQRQYDQARQDWAEFIKAFPQNDKIPNAVFWQGECYYQMGQYGKAILAYQDVIDKYKKSSKYRASLLKQGMAFHKLGKPSPGKLRLESLIKQYPDSPEAARARQFLKGN